MLTGKLVGHGIASSSDGLTQVPYVIIRPESTPANVDFLRSEARRWKTIADQYGTLRAEGKLIPGLWRRAEFTADCLNTIALELEKKIGAVVVVQSRTGELLGAAQYGTVVPPTHAIINLQAIDPTNLPGSPNGKQLRGIGTALVAALSQDLLARKVDTLWVKPLDEEAAIFWSRRGFGVCAPGGLLCIREQEKLKRLMGTCVVQPDSPVDGEYIVCGIPTPIKEAA